MALAQADLDALNAAIIANELEVEYDGRRVRYRSVAEMKAAYAHAQTVIAQQSATSASIRRSTYQFEFTTLRGE
jgi:hypothetical protein